MFYLFKKDPGKNFKECIEVFDTRLEVDFYIEANRSRLPDHLALLEGEPRAMYYCGQKFEVESQHRVFSKAINKDKSKF